ncbi:MAG: Gfo/Idh/MocA family oxidoreductase [Promethearchaeota archaeon]|nr:MAG: Gfo/Idh/MocA family oxidoreductase [Candidatus Lokiarchaeota archaeon]
MLKYGFVGYGVNALGHKMELEQHPKLRGRAKLIAGYDPNPRAIENLKKVKDIKVARSFEDLLDTPDLEAIIISSPPQFHADQAVTALESGLHVFSEIPMALNEKEIEKIIKAEAYSKKVYQLGENYCFYPEVLYAGHLASSGKIGPTVYSESEYLHDITYRWRKEHKGGVDAPKIDSWYELFDPLMYAHSIGPAQVALGGIGHPMPFTEVVSFANDLGGYKGNPICAPAKAFHVGLFKTENYAIAKCANAYIIAREPTRITIQVIGRTGTYECYEIGKPGRFFEANDHLITRSKHRKGRTHLITKEKLAEVIEPVEGLYYGGQTRVVDDWLSAIEENKEPLVHAKIGGNFCSAGIAASESARSNGRCIKIKKYVD